MRIHFRSLIIATLVLAAGALATAGEADRGTRETLLLDFGWRYHLGDLRVNQFAKLTKAGNYGQEPGIGLAYDDSAWRPLDLPHESAIEGVHDRRHNLGHGYLPMEIGWYRRRFNLPKEDEGRRIFVEFEGAYRDMTLYVNQFLVGGHKSGYGSVRFDISNFVNFGGENVLAVRTDPTEHEGWWYEAGGLYGHTWLIKAGPVHITFGGVQVLSWFKTDPEEGKAFLSDEPEGPAKVRVKTTLFNPTAQRAEAEVRVRLFAPDGSEVAAGSVTGVVPNRQEVTLPVQFKVRQPALWSLDKPQLYRAQVEVRTGGRLVDNLDQNFGIRTIRFDGKQGFFLNGKWMKIHGAASHYDHAGVGWAVPDSVHAFRVQRLKEFGFNAYRTAHNPHCPALFEACDRLGMLVMGETRSFNGNDEALKDARQMALRDRNHPSIILWNSANEEVDTYRIPQGARLAAAITQELHAADPTRPVTMSRNADYDAAHAAAVDVLGFNYWWPGFAGRDHTGWDQNHAAFPDKPVVETEMGSTYTTRGVYDDQWRLGRLVEYDRGNFQTGPFTRPEVKRHIERPWMSGGFIWTGFDYRGNPFPFVHEDWARIFGKDVPCPVLVTSNFGCLDTCGFPKDKAYYYKAWWGNQPSLHVFPHWNFAGKEGQEIEVVAYSNAEEVELFVNGKSAGRRPMPKYDQVSWKVPYQPGAIEAVGYAGGKEILRQRRETTGPAVAVKLVAENGVRFSANREDAAVVKVAAVDAQGREVPTADNLIKFRVEGPVRLLGVANGDPADTQGEKRSFRKLWAGLAQVIVGAMDKPGSARLIAEADGLQPATLELTLADGPRRPYVPSTIKAEEAVMLWYAGDHPRTTTAPAPAKAKPAPTQQEQDAQIRMLLSPLINDKDKKPTK